MLLNPRRRDLEEGKNYYMININLTGLHTKIYRCRYNEELDGWWSGPNVDIDVDRKYASPDHTQIVFENKEDAEKCLEILKTYQKHIKEHL